jgi:hypothetical protein
MAQKEIATGVVHDVPADLRNILTADSAALALWEDITPLARMSGSPGFWTPGNRTQGATG